MHSLGDLGHRRQDRRELGRQTETLVGTLGHEPRAVANALAAAGVRGQPADARQCALAMYVRAVMEGDDRVGAVRVFHDRLMINSPGRFRQHRVTVMLPSAVRSFISGFDAELYPELVRSGEDAAGRVPAPQTSPEPLS